LHLICIYFAFSKRHTIHEAQAWARVRGNRFFTSAGDEGSRTDDPLFRFKSTFWDQSYPFYTGRWILDREAYEALRAKYSQVDKTKSEQTSGSFFPAYRKPI
jgi:hypothetical protein